MNRPQGFLVSLCCAENRIIEEPASSFKKLNFFELGVLSNIISLCPKKTEMSIELFSIAQKGKADCEQVYTEAFRKLGCGNVRQLAITSREELDSPGVIKRIGNCDCIFILGKDPLCLSSFLGGTRFLSVVKERYLDEPFIVAGAAAGALVLCHTFFYGIHTGSSRVGEVKISCGLSLLNNVIIDTHFDDKGRFNRLAQAIAIHPGVTGIGLGEGTGIIVSEGKHVRVAGPGTVTIIDGRNIRYNNIADEASDSSLSVQNFTVHLLSNDDSYDISRCNYSGHKLATA